MATLLEADKLFYTPYEPKLKIVIKFLNVGIHHFKKKNQK